MSLYKRKDCFFISSFLAGKEAKEAGGTYEWFPLDPLSTFDGDAVPLDSPCSIGYFFVSHQAVVRTAPRERRATVALLKILVGKACILIRPLVLDRR